MLLCGHSNYGFSGKIQWILFICLENELKLVECTMCFNIEDCFWREFEMHLLKKKKKRTMEFLWQITKNSFKSKHTWCSLWRSMPHLFDISLILIVVYFERKKNSCNLVFLMFFFFDIVYCWFATLRVILHNEMLCVRYFFRFCFEIEVKFFFYCAPRIDIGLNDSRSLTRIITCAPQNSQLFIR